MSKRQEGGSLFRARVMALGVVCLLALTLGGCGWFCRIPRDPMGECAGDRCYIEDYQFIIADQLYSRLGSLVLVERHLREVEQWRDCEVNEALYRLRKVHSLP
jgi:hypothetical protein